MQYELDTRKMELYINLVERYFGDELPSEPSPEWEPKKLKLYSMLCEVGKKLCKDISDFFMGHGEK